MVCLNNTQSNHSLILYNSHTFCPVNARIFTTVTSIPPILLINCLPFIFSQNMFSKLCFEFLILSSIFVSVHSKCSKGCGLALGSYYVWPESNLTVISDFMNIKIEEIVSYNKQLIPNQNSVQSDIRINIPFPCDCINGEFLGHVFKYSLRSGDTYDRIANLYYANLTTTEWLIRFNTFDPNNIPDTNEKLNVTVNCSCGSSIVSKDYGLFVTFPLRLGDSLVSVANQTNLDLDLSVGSNLLQSYNPGVNFSAGRGIVYVPGKGRF